jgi:secreted PhoX family phosphatase
MMALWPNDSAPTHIIACNEQGACQVGLQRINLANGAVGDIVKSGLSSCDPVEITAWGTLVFGEENGSSGRVFELLDPLHTTDVIVAADGSTSGGTDPGNIVRRSALRRLSFEGVSVLPSGVAYYGDENRPGNGVGGGAYFKFIPDVLYAGGGPITSLSQSPLVSGRVFGLRVGARSGNTDFGQGDQSGRGVWVEVVDGLVVGNSSVARANLGAAAPLLKLTTYYRPEDHDIDKAALAAGQVRFCGTNTGEDGQTLNYGESFCITDGTVDQAAVVATTTQTTSGVPYTINNGPGTSTPKYKVLIAHFEDFAMPDNIAYQPGSGHWIVHEDGEGPEFGRNNDIWSCVDDGADRNQLADACAKIITINDLTAETTGGVFDATGSRFFFSVQHNVTGHGVVLEVTGWKNVR